MDKVMSLLSQYLQEASTLVQHYGPGVYATTLALIRFSGIWHLSVGFFLLLVLPTFLTWVMYKDISNWGTEVFVVIAGTASVISLIAAGVLLLDMQNWIDTFNPQAGLLYALASKAGLF